MFRMIAYLSAGIFLTQLVGGRESPEAAMRPPERPVAIAAGTPTPAAHKAATAVVAPATQIVFDPARRAVYAPASAPALPQRPVSVPQPAPAAAPEPEPDLPVWYVTAKRVNVRAGPSTDDPVVDSIARNEAVLVVSGASADWVEIRIEGDGVAGYVAARYLSPEAPMN